MIKKQQEEERERIRKLQEFEYQKEQKEIERIRLLREQEEEKESIERERLRQEYIKKFERRSFWDNVGIVFITNEIFLPAVLIQYYNSDVKKLLKPVFDILWQAVGLNNNTIR